jgi:hypothetical protein
MTFNRLISVLICFVMLMSIQISFYYYFVHKSPKNLNSNKNVFSLKLMGVKTVYEKNMIKYVISFDEVIVRPKKFIVFSINPYDEIIFKNVHIDSFKKNERSDENKIKFEDLFQHGSTYQQKLPFFEYKRVISSGSIERFSYRIFLDEIEKVLLESESAEIDFSGNQLKLTRTIIKRVNEILKFDRGIWIGEENALYIPEKCIVIRPEGMSVHNKLRINM